MIQSSRRVIQIVLAILAPGVLIFVGIGVALRDKPVFAASQNDVRDHRGFQLLNPFHNRAPERAADSFLARLSGGDCSAVLNQLGEDPSRKQSVCESEQKYPMKGWQLEAIGWDGDRTLLRYGVSRDAGSGGLKIPFWIWLSKKDDNDYHVTATSGGVNPRSRAGMSFFLELPIRWLSLADSPSDAP